MSSVSRRNFLKISGIGLAAGTMALVASQSFQSVEHREEISSEPLVSEEPKYGGTKSYIANALGLTAAPLAAVGSGPVDGLVDTGVLIRIKQTFVLEDYTLPNETFDHMFCEEELDYQVQAFYMQTDAFQTVYRTSDDRYVVLAWPDALTEIDGTIVDWQLAADNDFGLVLDAYEFDPTTGILLLHVDELPAVSLQFQLLIRSKCTQEAVRPKLWVTVENDSDLAVMESQYLDVSAWNNCIEIPLVNPDQDILVTQDDLNVFVNGWERELSLDGDVFFDTKTGVLVVPLSTNTVQELCIRVGKPKLTSPLGARMAYAAITGSSMRFWKWMDGKLEWKDGITTLVSTADVRVFKGYGFNIHYYLDKYVSNRHTYDDDHTEHVSGDSAAFKTIVEYTADHFDDLLDCVYSSSDLASTSYDAASYTNQQLLDNSSRMGSLTMPAANGGMVNLTWNAVKTGKDHTGAEGAVVAVAHGMTLPSDSHSEIFAADASDFWPRKNGSADFDWWKPVLSPTGDRNVVSAVAVCTHAAVSGSGDGIHNDGDYKVSYHGPVMYRAIEADKDANNPYVIFCFYTPRRGKGADGSGGQAATSIVKFPVQSSGTLKVKKITTGTDADPNLEFSFRVTFSGTGAPADKTFSLHNNEVEEINDLPVGIVATVSETTPSTYSATWNPSDRKATIAAGADSAVTVTCTNTRKVGALTIQKILDGASTNHEFKLNLKVYRPDNSVFLNEDFYLKHNQTRTFGNLPTEYRYEVTEYPEDHFRCLSIDNGTGTIVENTAQQARVIARNRENGYATIEKHLSM